MPCDMCVTRGKKWDGGDPTCAFEERTFSPDNWNCATANAIRDIVRDEWDIPWPDGVDYQYCDDQKYATVKVDHIEDVPALALWVSWYKSRGRTEAMWLLDEYEAPRRPTCEECLAIIKAYKGRRKRASA